MVENHATLYMVEVNEHRQYPRRRHIQHRALRAPATNTSASSANSSTNTSAPTSMAAPAVCRNELVRAAQARDRVLRTPASVGTDAQAGGRHARVHACSSNVDLSVFFSRGAKRRCRGQRRQDSAPCFCVWRSSDRDGSLLVSWCDHRRGRKKDYRTPLTPQPLEVVGTR